MKIKTGILIKVSIFDVMEKYTLALLLPRTTTKPRNGINQLSVW